MRLGLGSKQQKGICCNRCRRVNVWLSQEETILSVKALPWNVELECTTEDVSHHWLNIIFPPVFDLREEYPGQNWQPHPSSFKKQTLVWFVLEWSDLLEIDLIRYLVLVLHLPYPIFSQHMLSMPKLFLSCFLVYIINIYLSLFHGQFAPLPLSLIVPSRTEC